MPAQSSLRRIMEERAALTRDQARDLMQQVLTGQLADLELAALLGAISARGEASAELAGFVDAMRAAATPVPLDEAERNQLVDTCGTGGDASGTFNISTAAALVAAAAGATAGPESWSPNMATAPSPRHAARPTCSNPWAFPVALSPELAAAALRSHRFAFLHAPTLHPAMKAVMPVRRALGVRTVFNVLGPLTNPAGARAQVMGVYSAHLVPIVAEAMRLLGVRHAFVVHGFVDSSRTLVWTSSPSPAPARSPRSAAMRSTSSNSHPSRSACAPLPSTPCAEATPPANAQILREQSSPANPARTATSSC